MPLTSPIPAESVPGNAWNFSQPRSGHRGHNVCCDNERGSRRDATHWGRESRVGPRPCGNSPLLCSGVTECELLTSTSTATGTCPTGATSAQRLGPHALSSLTRCVCGREYSSEKPWLRARGHFKGGEDTRVTPRRKQGIVTTVWMWMASWEGAMAGAGEPREPLPRWPRSVLGGKRSASRVAVGPAVALGVFIPSLPRLTHVYTKSCLPPIHTTGS